MSPHAIAVLVGFIAMGAMFFGLWLTWRERPEHDEHEQGGIG